MIASSQKAKVVGASRGLSAISKSSQSEFKPVVELSVVKLQY
jgi:hypothetical protein